jgi:hypothetical protein
MDRDCVTVAESLVCFRLTLMHLAQAAYPTCPFTMLNQWRKGRAELFKDQLRVASQTHVYWAVMSD